MQRRKFVSTSVIAGAAGTLAAPSFAQSSPAVRWRLASSYPKSLPTLYGSPESVCKRVLEATGGKFNISLHGPGEIVPAVGIIDAVQNNSIEAGYSAGAFYIGKNSAFAFDCAIPFGMNSRQMTAWMYSGDGLKLTREFFAEYNILNFPGGTTGAQMAGWFRKEIKEISDLKGLKMRISGLGGQVLERLGVVTQNLPAGDIYPALEKGTIDAAEFVGPADDERLGFNKIAKYYYFPSFWEGTTQQSFYVSSNAWKALPKEYQIIFELACAEAHTAQQAKYDALNPDALKRLVGSGTLLRAMPRSILDAGYTASQEIYSENSAKNPKWKKIYDNYTKFRDDSVSWFRFAEGGFDSFMAQRKKSG